VGRPTFGGARLERQLSPAAHDAIARIQRHTKLTQNVILLAAFYLLLARHGAGPDLVVGIPINGRRGAQADVVGFHANTLPVRLEVADELTVDELVRRAGRAFLDGLEHGGASFEAVQSALGVRSGDWRVPLFRHMFNFRPASRDGTLRVGGDAIGIAEVWHDVSRLDLEWIVWGSSDEVSVVAVYSVEVHDEAFVTALLDRYDAIVVEMGVAIGRPIGEIRGFSTADHETVRRLNATARDGVPATVGELVRACDAVALRHGDDELTYRQLLEKAEGVRRAVRAAGVPAGGTVALCAARGAGLAAATLGVWAAGCAYLPLDPSHPERRLRDQLADSGAALVLVDGTGPLCGVPLSDVDCAPPGTEWAVPSPDERAYVIYTSGSTGRPKGVEVSHRSLANLVHDFATRLGARAGERCLWLTTFSFDISALELFLPLATGGTVVVAADDDRVDARRLLGLIASADGVDIVQATPTTWRYVVDKLSGQLAGRRVLCGGEPLDGELARRLLAEGCRLFNVYGPTETTIWSTVLEVREPVGATVPIGGPIANTTVHVLDPAGRPVPPGVPGELCIGGAGVALGYRDRPELTAERFPSAPERGRYYRTGDRAVLTGDGLTFHGRLDRQVKIRGHRVEPGEIESVLRVHPDLDAIAVVTEPDGSGNLRLVAAVQGTATEESLRELAVASLPAGAVPSRFVRLSALPLTGNGKLDHRAVAERIGEATRGPVELPDDPMLRQLVQLWRVVLGDDRLDSDANFFLSGGHSLLAVDLADRIGAAFGCGVGFDAVFDAPTPNLFARRLARRLAEELTGLPEVAR
jgi:amino acid adenylation domain-containing protein